MLGNPAEMARMQKAMASGDMASLFGGMGGMGGPGPKPPKKDRDADPIFLSAEPFAPESRVREVMIGGEIVHRVKD